MKTRAAITDGRGSLEIVDDVQTAAPRGDEVRVRLEAAGVCHTDHDSTTWGRPLVLGHEGAGVVLDVGPEVDRVQPGERVLLNWAIPCGRCFQCRRGFQAICEVRSAEGGAHPEGTTRSGAPLARSFHVGTLSTHTLVRQAAVSRLPDALPARSACILGCGVMTGVGSVWNVARVQAGESVAVLGCGGVGINVVQGARIAGAAPIIAIDTVPERLEHARRLGATHTVLATGDVDATVRQVRELTDGRGADHAFEATGVPALGAAPLALVRNGGTAVQVSGIEEPLTIDMTLFEWDKTYINPLYGRCNPDVDFPRLFARVADGSLEIEAQIRRTYRLDELGRAFDDMLAGRVGKGVVILDGDG